MIFFWKNPEKLWFKEGLWQKPLLAGIPTALPMAPQSRVLTEEQARAVIWNTHLRTLNKIFKILQNYVTNTNIKFI